MMDWLPVVMVLAVAALLWMRLLWVAAREAPRYDWREEYRRSEQGEEVTREEHLP